MIIYSQCQNGDAKQRHIFILFTAYMHFPLDMKARKSRSPLYYQLLPQFGCWLHFIEAIVVYLKGLLSTLQ